MVIYGMILGLYAFHAPSCKSRAWAHVWDLVWLICIGNAYKYLKRISRIALLMSRIFCHTLIGRFYYLLCVVYIAQNCGHGNSIGMLSLFTVSTQCPLLNTLKLKTMPTSHFDGVSIFWWIAFHICCLHFFLTKSCDIVCQLRCWMCSYMNMINAALFSLFVIVDF